MNTTKQIGLKTLLWVIIICHAGVLSGQNLNTGIIVQGRILNKETNQPIPYAGIMSNQLFNATISDLKGYFKITVARPNDTIFASCIGFKKQMILLSEKKTFYTIYLEQNIQLLNEVTILPADDTYLYNLLLDCKKNASNQNRTAKAYFELKTFEGNDQIEMLESFFNADLYGYELADLALKTGRFALKKMGNTFFNSLESSKAILMNQLFSESNYFPQSPLTCSKAKMKKKFWLELQKKYLENNTDSMYVIRYKPKDSSGVYFNGQLWIDPQKKHLIKATFECRNCRVTPFVPLFTTDKLSNINLNITKTYKEIDHKMFFNHIDFSYQFDYDSRVGKEFEARYSLLTNAVLHVYDYNNTFFIPRFVFSENCTRDYWKINAMPYNNFFWEHHNEFEIIDHDNSNNLFYKENEAYSNINWYKENLSFKKVYECPFITWAQQRILIKDVSKDTLVNKTVNSFGVGDATGSGVIADRYKLSIKIFLDINTYSDSTNIITSTVFDPYETFYFLPVDSSTNCFLNIIFDVYEVERRNFEKSIQGLANNKDAVLRKYDALNEKLDKLKKQYLEEVDRGTRRKELEKWNQYVVDNLGINNMRLFHLIE